MFSRPLAFVLLALACVTAAAGGAYVATRRNAATPAVTTSATPPLPSTAASTAPSTGRPVVETESAVSRPAESTNAAPALREQPSTAAPVRHSLTQKSADTDPPARITAPVPKAAAAPSVPAANQPVAGTSVPVQPPAPPPGDAAIPPDPPPTSSAPQFDELTVPASSIVGVQIETPISSEYAQVEDRVLAHVTRDVLSDGRVAIPAGARVIGTVTLVDRGGKMKTPARLGIRFHTLVLADGSEVPLSTQEITRDGESPSADSAKKIGGAAIVGAILGGILGGGKGAVIGGTTGAGAGTAAVMAGDRTPAVIAQGATFNVRLAGPATIQVERR